MPMSATATPVPALASVDTSLAALFEAAKTAREKAYAPYSRFLVGAAILDGQGGVHVGCNVENAAYPEGTCAEAGAIAAMIIAGAREIAEIAIVGGREGRPLELCPPCGGCRQKIREFAGPDARIHLLATDGSVQTLSREALLPHSFGPDNLGDAP
ncbi:cytidine deaminase [Methyloraptor flagellatus]|uniref:Cytidine deaminase n=1 Tax=Methyloraptor flagellatus TaxID=3162530 RepID=A0AAU7X6M1_9HYPH